MCVLQIWEMRYEKTKHADINGLHPEQQKHQAVAKWKQIGVLTSGAAQLQYVV